MRLIRIVTQLDKDAVLAALHELASEEYRARFFSLQCTFEGKIDPQRLVIGYRSSGWFFPPARLATFSGRVRETDAGTRIHGNISSGAIIFVYAFCLAVITLLSIVGIAVDGNYFSIIWVLVIAALLFFSGRAFVRTTHRHVISEIGGAVRGKVTQD